MLWTIIGVLFVLWLLGVIFRIAGALIHVLLVVALALFVYSLFTRRRRAL